jgi:hypothetical protein
MGILGRFFLVKPLTPKAYASNYSSGDKNFINVLAEKNVRVSPTE